MLAFDLLKTIQEQFKVRFKYGFEVMGDMAKIETGLTPKTLALKDGSHSLYMYSGKKEINKPLLLVYSLINRSYIFDLRPGRSMIEYLCNEGFDVFLLDWEDPGPDAGFITLEELVNGTIHRCVKWLNRKYKSETVDILGYCMGATFAAMYTGIHPEIVHKLILLTPPMGIESEGILQNIAGKIDWESKISESGVISGRFLKLFFNSVRPATSLKKERDFWQNYDQEKYMEHFLPVEKWSNDTPDLPGPAFLEYLDICFKKDLLKQPKVMIGSSTIDFSKVKCPVFSVAAQHDWIIPASSLETVKQILPNAEHKTYLLPGGHIGLVIGRTATIVWEQIKYFLI